MKVFGGLALFLLFGAALTILNFSSPSVKDVAGNDGNLLFNNGSSANTLTIASRKLKENGRGNKKGDASAHVILDDYRPIDPLPSSMASLRPGPVDHGTPLNPFIPKPSPPSPAQPPFGGFT